MVLRYEMVECIYLRKDTKVKGLLKVSIVKLYTAILVYIAKALKYYSQSTTKKLGKSFIEGCSRVQNFLDQVLTLERDVDLLRRDVEMECLY
jgi:uncharacterized membrane protein YesL